MFWLLTDVLRDGSPCTNEYPKQQVSSKTAKIIKRLKNGAPGNSEQKK